MFNTQRHPIISDPVTGYQLDPNGLGWLAFVLPPGSDARNIVANPSVELNATGYNHMAGAHARDLTTQKWGVASLKVTPTSSVNDGGYYGTVALTAGRPYYFSTYFLGPAGLDYQIYFADGSGNPLGAPFQFNAAGWWQRVWVAYPETSSTTRRLYFTKNNHASTRPFWVDGLDCEADRLTTYIDGDQVGFVRGRQDYYWTGVPHASPSVRIAQSAAGGVIVPINQLGFRLLSIVGLGLGGIINQLTPLAQGGAYYQGTTIGDRQFTLVGQVDGRAGFGELQRRRKSLVKLLQPGRVTPDQPLKMLYSPADSCGEQSGPTVEILCLLNSDLSGHSDNLNTERLALNFQLFLPFVAQEEGNDAATLDFSDSLASNYAIERSAGQWIAPGVFNGAVRAVVYDPALNRVYFGGDFTTVNPGTGAITVNHICYLDDTGYHAVSTGTNGSVHAIAVNAGGSSLVLAGAFTTAGGGATKGLAIWLVGTTFWSEFNVTTASFTSVDALAIDRTGQLFIGGDFTSWDGITGADYIAMLDTAASWNALDTDGLNDAVTSLAVGLDGVSIYVAGLFTQGGAGLTLVLNGAAVYTPDVFAAMAGGIDGGLAQTILVNPSNGQVLYAGLITSVDGQDIRNVAAWDGNAWTQVGSGLPPGFGFNGMAYGPDGYLYGVGTLAMGGLSNQIGYRLAGNVWQPLDITQVASNPSGMAIAFRPDGTLFAGLLVNGAITASGVTTITNDGTANARPIFDLKGPGTLRQIRSLVDGKAIYFNLPVQAGESVTLDLSDPSRITFTSTFRGDILSEILPGSQEASFVLAQGANQLAVLVDSSHIATSGATAMDVRWRTTHSTMDGVAPGDDLP